MIRDHKRQSIAVTGDSSSVGADASVSLGLIVTELVINALKHAFPDGRAGKILVDYQSHGPNWTLAVSDDGVGMQPQAVPGPPVSAPALSKPSRGNCTLASRSPMQRLVRLCRSFTLKLRLWAPRQQSRSAAPFRRRAGERSDVTGQSSSAVPPAASPTFSVA
jgi:Histidine kinase-like ATPase domain